MIDLDLVARRLRRTGSYYDPEKKISVTIVLHPKYSRSSEPYNSADEVWAVETTVAGDRRLPVESPVHFEDAVNLALAQLLNPRDTYVHLPDPVHSPRANPPPSKRPYVPLGDLMERYKASGLNAQDAWKMYVSDLILLPTIRTETVDAKQFMTSYRKI